jgi:hypothetical protein
MSQYNKEQKMARFKDFGSDNLDEVEPLSFKLQEEDFFCIKQVQGKVLMEIVSMSQDSGATVSVELIEKFFSSVLVDESYERFEALLHDKDRIVTVETLGEITGWLIEQYTSRPTQRPEDSSSGQ